MQRLWTLVQFCSNQCSVAWAYPRFIKWGTENVPLWIRHFMVSAKNEAPKAPRKVVCEEGCPLPQQGTGLGRRLCPSLENVYFFSSKWQVLCILLANFIAVELPVTHKPVSLDFGL